MRFEDLHVGMSYQMSRAFSEKEVVAFSELSHDTNPVHLDENFASKSMFGQRIVPGFLTASLFSAIIGTKFPGVGSLYLSQNMRFLHPVFLNQTIYATVSVVELFPEKNRALLDTVCKDEAGTVLIVGTALVKVQ